MVLFAIIAIFDHYYKFCNVFKAKFERKTIRNIPKPNVIVKIRNFIPKLPVSPAFTYALIKYANSAIKVIPEAREKNTSRGVNGGGGGWFIPPPREIIESVSN
jgi:hypothetical protein